MDPGLRRAARHRRAERGRLRADESDSATAAASQGAPRQSDVPAAGSATGDHRPRRQRRSGQDEQIRRYQDAATRQQGELDRVTSQAKRMGCDSSGFFSLFNGQSAQCGPVNNQIQQMRANLDQITTSLERLRGGGFGGADRDNQRRSVLTALAQNNCGPQYANAAAGARAIFWTICSATTIRARRAGADIGPAIRNLPHRLCPQLRRLLSFRSRSRPCRRGSPTTKKPARRSARRRRPPCSPIAIPART